MICFRENNEACAIFSFQRQLTVLLKIEDQGPTCRILQTIAVVWMVCNYLKHEGEDYGLVHSVAKSQECRADANGIGIRTVNLKRKISQHFNLGATNRHPSPAITSPPQCSKMFKDEMGNRSK